MLTAEHEKALRELVHYRIMNAQANIQDLVKQGQKISQINSDYFVFSIPELTSEAKRQGLGKGSDGSYDIPSCRDFAELLNEMAQESDIEKTDHAVRVYKREEFAELFGG